MATLDGLNIIEADEVNSSVITFDNYLNGISPQYIITFQELHLIFNYN